MKRWHALYFALAILVAADSMIGSRDHEGVLVDADRKAVAAAKVLVEQAEGEQAPRPAPAREPSVAHLASDNPWALDGSEVSDDWGEPAVEIGEYHADAAVAASAGPVESSPRTMPSSRPAMTVAGSRVEPEDRSLIEA